MVRDTIDGCRQLCHGFLALIVVIPLLFSHGSLLPSTGLDTGDTECRRDMAPVLRMLLLVGKKDGKCKDI